jgi:carbon storage regulator CsrA
MSTQSTQMPGPQDHPGTRWVIEQEAGDSVVIAGEIEIVLLEVKGDSVQIGVIAPEGVAIEGGEVRGERSGTV